MPGEKRRFYILAQQISGNRACMYALAGIYALWFKMLGELYAVLGIQKSSTWGTGVGQSKV